MQVVGRTLLIKKIMYTVFGHVQYALYIWCIFTYNCYASCGKNIVDSENNVYRIWLCTVCIVRMVYFYV